MSSAEVEEQPARKRGRPRLDGPSPAYRQRQADIISTAATVFRARGYDAGSLDDVAEALGLRKASLYYYVRSKAELLYLIFDRALSEGLATLEARCNAASPADRLRICIDHQVRLLASDTAMFKVFFENRPLLSEEFEHAIQVKEARYLAHFVDAVTTATDAGILPAVNPRYAAQGILGMTTWTYQWFEAGRDEVDEVSASLLAVVLCRGGQASAQRRRKKASPRSEGA